MDVLQGGVVSTSPNPQAGGPPLTSHIIQTVQRNNVAVRKVKTFNLFSSLGCGWWTIAAIIMNKKLVGSYTLAQVKMVWCTF